MPRNRPPRPTPKKAPQSNAELSTSSIDAAIITVLDDETAAVLARLTERRLIKRHNQSYYVGVVPDRHGRQCGVALARISRQGQIAAAETVGILLEDLNPKVLVVLGIGAALPDGDLTLGDVVVATTFSDFAITAALEGTRPEFSSQSGPIRPDLQDFVALLPALGPDIAGWNSPEAIGIARPEVQVDTELFYGPADWKRRTRQAIDESFLGSRKRPAPIVTTRSIASSGLLVKDAALVREWRKKASAIVSVEGELANVYAAARRRNRDCPVIAIRGISEIVGFQRDPAWIPYACSSAASFLFAALRSGFLADKQSSTTLSQWDSVASVNARIIVLGNGGVGKTSLVQRLASERFRQDTGLTHGLRIVPLRMMLRNGVEAQLHVWDFGGQELYYETNRIFMTGGNLYLLVLDARVGWQDKSLQQWLQTIESVGGESPIIVVINKVDLAPAPSLDLEAIQPEYRKRIRAVASVSCLDGTGISELRDNIIEFIQSTVPAKTFPANWLSIRTALSERTQDLISLQAYQELCNRNGVSNRPEQDALLQLLHAEGFVFYSLEPTLSGTIVLNPEWIIAGLGNILMANVIRSHSGEFGLATLQAILDPKRYPVDSHVFLVELMRVFELCLPLFDTTPSRYLIPQLLPPTPVDIGTDFQSAASVQFRYSYKIWFVGLLPRLIVRTYSLSSSRRRWRSGVVLEFEGSRGLILEDTAMSRIDVFVIGPVSSRSRLLQIVRSDVDYVNAQLNLAPAEYVVLPQDRSVAIEVQHLQKYNESGVQSIPLIIGERVQNVDVRTLLSMVGTTVPTKGEAVKLFVSYAPSDEALYAELETHLKLLARAGSIDRWTSRRIARSKEPTTTNALIESADLILCLVSSEFLASDYCYEVEMRRALERHESGQARLIPIIVRECAWHQSPLGRLQALPSDGKAITGWRDRDQAWASVIQGIQEYIDWFRYPVQARSTLSITRIELHNIRCISSFSADLGEAPPARVSVIFGENGLGKSTILRSIALCLLPEAKAISLFEQLPGDLLKRNESRGFIMIEVTQADGRRWQCKVLLERSSTEGVDPIRSAVTFKREVDPEFPQENVFVCAYGAGRRSIATADPAGSFELDAAVTTLFNYNSPLQNPELILRRMIALGKPIDSVLHKLDAALSLEAGSTTLDATGIRVQGSWGAFVPYGALGDGYQATLGWLSDFLGHQMLFDKDCPVPDISGIVLVDELEQHLHPRWQREIIQSLNHQFPGVQFITTSHSPVCAGGLADLPDQSPGRLVVLERSITGETLGGLSAIPAGLRYDEIMTSKVIGLDVARDKTTEALQDQLQHAFEKAGGRIDQNPDFADIMEVIKSRSATASEDLRQEFVQEQLRRSAGEVEAAILAARRKK